MSGEIKNFKIETPFFKLLLVCVLILGSFSLILNDAFQTSFDFIIIAYVILTSQPVMNYFFHKYFIHEDKISFGKSAMQQEIPFDKIEKIEVVEQSFWINLLGLPQKHLKVHFNLDTIRQTYPIYNTSKEMLSLHPQDKFSQQHLLTVS